MRLAGKRDDRIVGGSVKHDKAPMPHEISDAVAAYLAKGGVIKKLKSEVPPPHFERVGFADRPGRSKANTDRTIMVRTGF